MAEARIVEFDLDLACGSAFASYCEDHALHAEGLGGVAVEDLNVEALEAGRLAGAGT
ncbi:hypothetical protein [Streptomyces lydicus]|uniref:hypothetical protein n=1 Tax=Streptomyces lydicus TaxID=47763 RepID=UPI0037155ECE